MDSILTSIKAQLGIHKDDTSFDEELIIHINTVFSILTQLGVGNPNGFYISDASELWTDYISDMTKIEMLKSYVYMKTKILFDPPTTSAVADATNRMISELESRLFMEFNYVDKEDMPNE